MDAGTKRVLIRQRDRQRWPYTNVRLRQNPGCVGSDRGSLEPKQQAIDTTPQKLSRQRDKDIGNWMGMGFSLLSLNFQLSPKLRKRGRVPHFLKWSLPKQGPDIYPVSPGCWQAALHLTSASSSSQKGTDWEREGPLLKLDRQCGL